MAIDLDAYRIRERATATGVVLDVYEIGEGYLGTAPSMGDAEAMIEHWQEAA